MDSRKFLSDPERDMLETFLRARIETDTRNAAMILTALHTGARASELLALQWRDINLDSGEIHIETLKGGRPRSVAVPRFVRGALALLRALSPEHPFTISYSRLAEVWSEYRPVRKPFHSLRHTYAMRVYEKSKDIRLVMFCLGHKSIESTMVYAEYQYTTSQYKKMMRIR